MRGYAYRWVNSHIHALHPLCMLIWVLSTIFLALIISDPLMLFIIFLATIPYAILGKIGTRWFAFVKLGVYMVLFIIIINILVSRHGTTVLFQFPNPVPVFGHFAITLEAFVFGLGMSIRLLIILSAFAIMTLTINPDDLFDLFMKTKLPARAVFTTSLATRFVPTLMRDLNSITISLQARGYELDNSKRIRGVKKRANLLIPLLSNSLDRAIQIAEAMESRAFGSGQKRISYAQRKITRLDASLIMVSSLPAIVGMNCLYLGLGNYQYYPTNDTITFDTTYLLTLLSLFLAVAVVAFLSPVKGRLGLD